MKKYRKWIWMLTTAFVSISAAGLLFMYFGGGMWALLSCVTLAVILVFFSLSIYNYTIRREEGMEGFPAKDERTMSVEMRADSHALAVTFWFIYGLMFFALIKAEGERRTEFLPALVMLILCLIVIMGSKFAFRSYLKRGMDEKG